jgi:hypothetical protein
MTAKPESFKNQPVGKIASKMVKNPLSFDAREVAQSVVIPGFMEDLKLAVTKGSKGLEGDFFIECLFKNEAHLPGVMHDIFLCKKICPKPYPDQKLFKYFSGSDNLYLVWFLPSREFVNFYRTCLDRNTKKLDIFRFTSDFLTGTLDRRANESLEEADLRD